MDLEELTPYGGGALKPSMDMRQLFVDNITVEGDTLCYDAESEGGPGLYVGVEPTCCWASCAPAAAAPSAGTPHWPSPAA